MNTDKKLHVLLAVTDQLRGTYKRLIADYVKFFSKTQGAFRGEKRTYTSKEGTIDDPSKRGVSRVSTTVDEKIDYFIDTSEKFIDSLFAQEATNASGKSRANLVVEGEDWGEFSSLELLRLKSVLESSDLGNLGVLIDNIPVRSDSEVWEKTEDDDYHGRSIYQTELFKGVAKTTVKTPFIILDPNLKGKEYPSNYQPSVASRDDILELGDYTKQNFSGEWSQLEKANSFRRKTKLLTAITEALKVANECEVVESKMNAERLFGYLFYNRK